ncbi:MAG: chalcone isomerase family protein, partial [Rhodoferax sp.]
MRAWLLRLMTAMLLVVSNAWAHVRDSGADTPPTVATALPGSQLVGQARLTVWGYKIYDASLWARPGFVAADYSDTPLALRMTYLHTFKAKDIVALSLKEMRRNAPINEAQSARWTADLLRVIPDVKPGDSLLGVYQPGQGAAFWVDGRSRGEIRDAEFAKLFFG